MRAVPRLVAVLVLLLCLVLAGTASAMRGA
jgi:hypothetical protein